MAETAASTAYGPMVLVALEQPLPAEQRIVDDKLAYQMLPTYMKLMVKACSLGAVRQWGFNMSEKAMPGIWNGFPCRKRHINETVLDSLKHGMESVVILGAGLDTLAYRLSQLSALDVYEVDLPENIAYKKKKLESIYGAVPAHVTLVPVDFQTQNLENALNQAGYSFDTKTIFVWEAVTQYLTEAAVRDTMQVLAKAKSASRLVFTYVVQDFIDGTNTYGLDGLYERFRVKSQLWQFGLHPHKVADFVGEYGWQVLEQVGGKEFTERYIEPLNRGTPIAEIENSVYCEKL
jgi:methyltransferase (TIGR00027 family)